MFAPLKRRMDDEGDEHLEQLSFDRKKRRVLAFRPPPINTGHEFSFQSLNFIATSTISPPPETNPGLASASRPFFSSPTRSAHSAHSSQSSPSLPDFGQGEEIDLDMEDSLPMYSPSPSFLLSPASAPARLPTPIFGSFFLHPASAQNHNEMKMDGVDASDPTSQYRFLERRCLPSPIREVEDGLLSPMSAAGEVVDRLDIRHAPCVMELDDNQARPSSPNEGGNRQRRGRSRSRRADGKDRAEGKPVLSMGYRADCEKCRAKVPGHYSHVIRA